MLPAVDVKEEEVNKLSCSAVHLGWSGAIDGEYRAVSSRLGRYQSITVY